MAVFVKAISETAHENTGLQEKKRRGDRDAELSAVMKEGIETKKLDTMLKF
jgi:hypothetical protein